MLQADLFCSPCCLSLCIACRRRYEAEYEEAKRRTKEALHPLRVELMDVEDQVRLVVHSSRLRGVC